MAFFFRFLAGEEEWLNEVCVAELCHGEHESRRGADVHAPWRKHTWHRRLIRGESLDIESKWWEWLIWPVRLSYTAARVRRCKRRWTSNLLAEDTRKYLWLRQTSSGSWRPPTRMKYFLGTDKTDRFTKGSISEPGTITLSDSCTTSYSFDLFGK